MRNARSHQIDDLLAIPDNRPPCRVHPDPAWRRSGAGHPVSIGWPDNMVGFATILYLALYGGVEGAAGPGSVSLPVADMSIVTWSRASLHGPVQTDRVDQGPNTVITEICRNVPSRGRITVCWSYLGMPIGDVVSDLVGSRASASANDARPIWDGQCQRMVRASEPFARSDGCSKGSTKPWSSQKVLIPNGKDPESALSQSLLLGGIPRDATRSSLVSATHSAESASRIH